MMFILDCFITFNLTGTVKLSSHNNRWRLLPLRINSSRLFAARSVKFQATERKADPTKRRHIVPDEPSLATITHLPTLRDPLTGKVARSVGLCVWISQSSLEVFYGHTITHSWHCSSLLNLNACQSLDERLGLDFNGEKHSHFILGCWQIQQSISFKRDSTHSDRLRLFLSGVSIKNDGSSTEDCLCKHEKDKLKIQHDCHIKTSVGTLALT